MKFNILFDFDFIWGGFMGEVLGINVVYYNKNFRIGCFVVVING